MRQRSHSLPIKAILGGTFNPPHKGHIGAALDAADKLGIQQVHLMPCKIPPHKPVEVSESHRVKMIELCCQENLRLKPELIELDLPSPSYTVKTLRALRQKSEQTICFFIGADSLYNLSKWFEWEHLLTYCHLVVMRRDGESFTPCDEIRAWLDRHAVTDTQVINEKPSGAVLLVDTPLYPISSTDIRSALSENKRASTGTKPLNIDEWVPRHVIDYITTNQLYKS